MGIVRGSLLSLSLACSIPSAETFQKKTERKRRRRRRRSLLSQGNSERRKEGGLEREIFLIEGLSRLSNTTENY